MPTSSQRTFLLRHRMRLLAGYGILLICSWITEAVLKSPPTPALSPTPPLQHGSLLVLLDPLQENTARTLTESAERLVARGYGARSPILPGLNAVDTSKNTFASLADKIIPLSYPEIVIANGHAGGVALQYAARHPDAVSALILVDASGVQEFAMLGEYHLNYAMYVVSDFALTLLDHLVPHFGSMNNLNLQRSQLELLRRSDRRNLRPLFAEIEHPTLVVEHNPNETNQSKASEHARLLPQSQILNLSASQALDPALLPFLHTLETGEAISREEVSAQRIEEAAAAFDVQDRPRPKGWNLALLLICIALATLVTEDLTCAVTGLMIANGNLTWVQGIGACLFGILFGDYLLFWAGRIWGRAALQKVPLRWMIDPVTLRETEEWFKERAARAILISRCLPGTRLPAYVAAGLLGVPVRVFTAWFVIGALIWTPVFVSVSWLLAGKALAWLDKYHHIAPALVLLGFLIYFVLTHILLPCLNWRGRRKVYGRWQRLTRSEFWPTPLLYFPVVSYLLIRSLRRGCKLMDFTACNPCIPGSGVVEESKSKILSQFQDQNCIAPFHRLPAKLSAADKISAAQAWMQEPGFSFPVVVKPDAGQRGEQVFIVRNTEQLTRALSGIRGDIILQQFIKGEEFGVFYIHPPEAEKGFIFGITRKAFPVLTGDGIHNLEDLILGDNRTVCQARMFMEAHADRLYDIPKAGEFLSLTDVGNHSRGTEFREGTPLITPELTVEIQRMASTLPGFHFGRFDLIAPSVEDFQSGKHLRIIELNGVTSEATNLYDPAKTYIDRIRILLTQWKWASRIGQHHRENGTRLFSVRLVLRHFDRYRKRKHAIRLEEAERKRDQQKKTHQHRS
jgi:membrane protein DedA with SNARE-associated domain